jgi:small subunit ribosomal protein S16
MVVIRLRRMGSSRKAFYRVVVTEARTARESSFVENVGTYNPRSKPANVQINKDRVKHWLSKGARPSNTVRTLLEKHLSRDLSAPPIEPAAAQ